MLNMKELIWLLPIIFVVHDFEEIILIKSWKIRNADLFKGDVKIKPYKDFISTESFSVAVLEELIILIIVTFISTSMGNYLVWYGLMFAVVLHFIPHILMSLMAKRFVPGVFTAVVFLPIGVYLLYISAKLTMYSTEQIILSCVLTSLVFLANLKWLHYMMARFDKWVNRKEK